MRHSGLRSSQQFTEVRMGAKWCSQPARPGDQEKSHKTTLISLSPGSLGKWKTNGMWIPSVRFTLENETFSLPE